MRDAECEKFDRAIAWSAPQVDTRFWKNGDCSRRTFEQFRGCRRWRRHEGACADHASNQG
jgi:hypothetical protein